MGAQRATKILGLFTRLDRRDGKPQYLRLLPRVEQTLARNLAHPALEPLRRWFETHLPRALGAPGGGMSVAAPPRIALVFAAGLGTRMRPLTDTAPKPLIKVAGRALIDHSLDRFAENGVETAIVNVHYLADQIEAHLASAPASAHRDFRRARPAARSGRRDQARARTGWARRRSISATRTPSGSRDRAPISRAWPLRSIPHGWMRCCCRRPAAGAVGVDWPGDFEMDADGRLTAPRARKRSRPSSIPASAFLKPELFDGVEEDVFRLAPFFWRAAEQGRLFGLRLDGLWLHVGRPETIAEAEAAIARSAL